MKKAYQRFLWCSYIALGIVGFFFIVAVTLGTIFLWFTNEDLFLKGLMSVISCVLLIFWGTEINKLLPSRWQEKKKEMREEIEIKSTDWIEHTWLPLKRNSKRKKFWLLQLWPLGKFFSYVTRLILDLIVYLIGVFGTAYILVGYSNEFTASNIFAVLITVIYFLLLSVSSHLFIQMIKQELTMSKLFKGLFDLFVLANILTSLLKQMEQFGRTIGGLKQFLRTFDHFVNDYMYLFEICFILALLGYVFMVLVKRSIEKEIIIDLIPTLAGYEYYVDYGKYEGLLHTNTVHANIQEFINKEIKNFIRGDQTMKFVDRQKKVYNFYEVDVSLRYGIGNFRLGGSNIQQNKSYFNWKSGVLENLSEERSSRVYEK
ncbi:hypothetical protein ACJQ40_001963 [Enterococcus faecium]|nr:hypothetical protein [Enterococcus faecium]